MDVYETARQFIMDEIGCGGESGLLMPDTNLQETGVLDSMSTLKLISFLEERFNIAFEPSDLDAGGFSSLRSIERTVNTRLIAGSV